MVIDVESILVLIFINYIYPRFLQFLEWDSRKIITNCTRLSSFTIMTSIIRVHNRCTMKPNIIKFPHLINILKCTRVAYKVSTGAFCVVLVKDKQDQVKFCISNLTAHWLSKVLNGKWDRHDVSKLTRLVSEIWKKK